jgi:hypothetical protein
MNDQSPTQRREVRYQIEGEIEGYIVLAPIDDDIPFKILNGSKSGMCITTSRQLPNQTKLTLIVNQLIAQVFVAWMIPDSVHSGRFKYGIDSLTDEIDFVDALQANGLLSEDATGSTTSESEAFVDEFFTGYNGS